ncbi:MAG: protein-disulfide reductase DsbD [Sphingomonadaceae bacterium]|jgi:thiol:disulfide interchange protein DsbD|nr:protein-disulfide reductase DsbD [Sphingomonadaceae bacterium]
MSIAERVTTLLRSATLCLALLVTTAAQAAPDNFGGTFLPPTQAFRPSAEAISADRIQVRFDVQPGYYLYREKLGVDVTGLVPAGVQLTPGELPKGIQKDDPNFGPTEIYQEPLNWPIQINGGQRPLTLTLSVRYQGCASQGICYPPEIALFPITLPAATETVTEPTPAPNVTPPQAANGITEIARSLDEGMLWLNLLLFFGAGVGLAFTPCMLPMMPIVVTVILGRHDDAHPISHTRGFMLALFYVLGMAITYSVAGVFAGLSGTLVSGLLQNPWVLGSFALVYVVLAGGMLGFYTLQLPNALQGKLAEGSQRLHGGSLPAVFGLGALSALIVGPCVAAPLAGALLYIGQTGNAFLGGLLLFSLALGMGVPLLAMGASAGTLVPKTGPWMESIKKAFGFILLGTAWWIVSPVLPGSVTLGGFGVLAVLAAVLLRAIDRLPPRAPLSARLAKALGIIFLMVGLAWIVGALAGGTRLDKPLSPFTNNSSEAVAQTTSLPMLAVTTPEALDNALRDSQKPVFIDVYADWCVSCKEFERDTLSDPAVRQALEAFTLIRVDVTASDDAARNLLKRFGLYGPPGMVFYAPGGRLLHDATLAGYVGPGAFLKQLNHVQTLATKATP